MSHRAKLNKRNKRGGRATQHLEPDASNNLISFLFAGFNIGTLPEDQVLLALGAFVPVPGETRLEERTLQVRMTRDHAKRLGEALLIAASAVHIPDDKDLA